MTCLYESNVSVYVQTQTTYNLVWRITRRKLRKRQWKLCIWYSYLHIRIGYYEVIQKCVDICRGGSTHWTKCCGVSWCAIEELEQKRRLWCHSIKFQVQNESNQWVSEWSQALCTYIHTRPKMLLVSVFAAKMFLKKLENVTHNKQNQAPHSLRTHQ